MQKTLRDNHLKFILSVIIFQVFANYLVAQKHIYPPEKPLWDADSLGNQRAVVRVKKPLDPATVTLFWRNRNVTKNQKVIVVDSSSNVKVSDVKHVLMGPEKGTISFKATHKGIYYVYFLPYKLKGSTSYPDAKYISQDPTSNKPAHYKDSKGVSLLRIESVDAFNSNMPMEEIAMEKEAADLKKRYSNFPYLVFPEKREFPIKMKEYIPLKWVNDLPFTAFEDNAKRGENFTFQLGVWASKNNLEDIELSFSDFKSSEDEVILSSLFTCFNTEGINYKGEGFTKTTDLKKGFIKALWCGIQIPENIKPGSYSGRITVRTKNQEPTFIDAILNIEEELAKNHSIDEPWKQTRLRWLNSTLAQENTVIEPYIPLRINGDSIDLLGRRMTLNQSGFPEKIESFFKEEMTGLSDIPKDIISKSFEFYVLDDTGQKVNFKSLGLNFKDREAGLVSWSAKSVSSILDVQVDASLEFDGHANFEVALIAKKELNLNDIGLHIPMNSDSAKYILGLGHKGSKTPEHIDWKWNVAKKNQDGFWLGDVNAGVQLSLRGQNYERPLNTNFYLQKPLKLPESWGNKNKGGIKIIKEDSIVRVKNYSGKRQMKKGDTLYFNYTLLITPFHTLNTDWQWQNRFIHAYKPIDTVKQSGANIVNVHHANRINPYINYPFIATDEMKSFVDSAHAAGIKVKIYNTIREVSNRLYELYPIKNLDHEIFSSGAGGGYSWLQEHLDGDYISAWYVPKYKDAAIINSGANRWHNYYVEGMNWLVNNIGIDGIYLDDVAFDRVTMKRIKRILTQQGHPGIIDLHSANQYNERDGYTNSANLYMEHFPYINRLWFGEYFDYEAGSPEFFLTEVSGIPFGLMGEMLQDGGNAWRGMLYGMTNRYPWSHGADPRPLWKVWDDFRMQGTQMIGYWVSDNPVKTNNEDVLVTIYKKNEKVLVSIASWALEDTSIRLDIDWAKLGLDPKRVKISAPEIENFQISRAFSPDDEIFVKKNKGWLLIIG